MPEQTTTERLRSALAEHDLATHRELGATPEDMAVLVAEGHAEPVPCSGGLVVYRSKGESRE